MRACSELYFSKIAKIDIPNTRNCIISRWTHGFEQGEIELGWGIRSYGTIGDIFSCVMCVSF